MAESTRKRGAWPPPRPRQARVPARPWDPRHPSDPDLRDDADRLVYAVVDELVGEWVGLSVSPWPDADSRGRLRFRPGIPPLQVAIRRAVLVAFLRTGIRPRGTPLRIGSVFAARVREGTAEEFLKTRARAPEGDLTRVADLSPWLERPCDLSRQARQVAKLAYYGALLSTLPEQLEEDWRIKR